MEINDPRHHQLPVAIQNDEEATALSIVRGGINVNGEQSGITHLCRASVHGRVPVVAFLLELGVDASKADRDDWPPLHAASCAGHQEVVELLVEVGNAQLDNINSSGWTALHAAVYGGQIEPVRYLVARGCTIDARTNNGNTALDLATAENSPQVAHFLTSAAHLTTTHNYRGLLSLCAPFTSPYLSLNIVRSLRYATILAARHARRIHDDPSLHIPINPFLLRLALLPSAYNRATKTESQVFRHILTFVGTGFPLVAPNQESVKSVGVKRARDER
jgi:ankyrin repeat protein